MFSYPTSRLAQKYRCRITNEERDSTSGSWWQKNQGVPLSLSKGHCQYWIRGGLLKLLIFIAVLEKKK